MKKETKEEWLAVLREGWPIILMNFVLGILAGATVGILTHLLNR